MNQFEVLYEIGEVSDGGELAELFLKAFLEDVDGLDHQVKCIENDVPSGSVTATIETRARISEEWFDNADYSVRV